MHTMCLLVPTMLVLLLGAAVGNRRSLEPQCTSQFDYNHKLLYKMITVEEEVKKFRTVIEEMKKLKQELENDQRTKLAAALEGFTKTSEDTLQKFKDETGKVKTDMEGAITTFATTTQKLINKPAVGFTVKYIKALPSSSDHATFATVVSNIGNGYDTATGLFTCSVKGTYYFSASLLKDYGYTSQTYCRIYKNNDKLVIAYTSPNHTGYVPAVNSVYVHLEVGDTVKLADCGSLSNLYQYSSFSGFLVTQDTS